MPQNTKDPYQYERMLRERMQQAQQGRTQPPPPRPGPSGPRRPADPAEELKNYFDDEFCDAFAGIAKLSVEKGSTLTIYDDYYVHIKAKDEMGGSSSGGEGSTVIIPKSCT